MDEVSEKEGKEDRAARVIQRSVRNYLQAKHNLQELVKEEREGDQTADVASTWRLPDDILFLIAHYLDDNSLLAFRATAHKTAAIAEEVFGKRASIKTPLACFSLQQEKHPFPHTASYFLRKRLWSFFDLFSGETYKEKEVVKRTLKKSSLLNCADFCHRWNYVGENVFRIFGNGHSEADETRTLETSHQFWEALINNNEDNPDIREMKLWFCTLNFSKRSAITRITEADKLNTLFKVLRNEANRMTEPEQKGISCFYMNATGKYLYDFYQVEAADICYRFSVAQGNSIAQNYFGERCKQTGNYKEAAKYYKLSADQGFSIAQNNLGVLLKESGDTAQAKRYFQMAANQGNLDAQCSYAALLRESGDIERAKKYDQIAAKTQFNLGSLLEQKGDIEGAKKYYKMAADREHAQAQYNLAMLLKQKGDIEGAKKYYKMAADRGHVEAQYNLAMLLKQEGDIEGAARYYKMAADQGHAKAQCNLASIFKAGCWNIQGIEKYYKMAADQGEVEAQWKLGLLLRRKGHFEDAEKYCKMAADQGEAVAQFYLGRLLRRKGRFEDAEKYCKMAADQGYAKAQLLLGVLFDPDPLLIKSPVPGQKANMGEAKKYYKMAADQGNAKAQYSLGLLLEWESSIGDAKKYYKMASDQGDFGASGHLMHLLIKEGDIEGAKKCSKMMHRPHNKTKVSLERDAKRRAYTQCKLAFLLEEEGNINGAIECLKVAATSGDMSAQGYLGILLEQTGNIKEAKKYHKMAADQGCVLSQLILNSSVFLANEG